MAALTTAAASFLVLGASSAPTPGAPFRRLGERGAVEGHLAQRGLRPYAQWLGAEHQGRRTAHDSFRAACDSRPADSPFWQIEVADPQRDAMSASAVYQRGARTLQALRERIGGRAFFRLLPAWTRLHRYGNADADDFVRLAERVSGRQLDDLLRTWLFTTGKPAL